MKPGQNDRTEVGSPSQAHRPEASQTDAPTNDFGSASSLGHDVSAAVRGSAAGPDLFAGTDSYPIDFGPYELLGELARGGMGVVYRARQRGLGRTVALKMILGGLDVHPSSVRRLELEARAAAALDHPNVVPIYDTGEVNGRRYFTMAFVDGPNLKGHVDARGRPTVAEAVRLFAQIVDGVAHAHRHGVIHRDLKPANVLIDKDGRPRVTDFGLAKKQDTDGELTRTGQVMGTPQYMAPEQARGTKDAGKPADVYSLGAILYYLLTNRPPLVGESVTDLLVKVVTETPRSPREVNPDVPRDVDAVCMKCLAKNPAERFADAAALAAVMGPIAERYTRRSTTEVDLEAHGVKLPKHFTPAAPRPAVPPQDPRPADTAPDPTPVELAPPIPPLLRSDVLPPPPQSSKVPLLLAGVAALAAVTAVAVVLLRPPARHEVAGGADRPTAANSGDGTTTPPGNGGGPAALANPPIDLPPLRKEFPLSVRSLTPAAVGPDGVSVFRAGTTLRLHLRSDLDCSIAVYTVDPAGVSTQLFPNEYDTSNALRAGVTREVPPDRPAPVQVPGVEVPPSARRYDIEMTPTAGTGVEVMRVVAVAGRAMPLPRPDAVAGGVFPEFRSPGGQQRMSEFFRTRGAVVKGRDGVAKAEPPTEQRGPVSGSDLVSEYELRYRVVR